MIILAYSIILQCPPKMMEDDASVKVEDVPINQTMQPFGIVPDNCESPMRGLQFDKIYDQGKWFEGKHLRHPSDFYSNADWPPKDIQRISASGAGSDRGYATVTSLKIITDAISKFNVKSMIDIPCGDVNWIFDSLETDTLPLYIGLDISFGVIDVNKQRFGHHKNKHFRFWDATVCPLPATDLVHVRDVIQHMTLDQGVKYFCNVFKSDAKVLITTTFSEPVENMNIREGGFYENNLLLEPFSFPPGNCNATHPKHEKDLTCVYNLTEGWVHEFMLSKC